MVNVIGLWLNNRKVLLFEVVVMRVNVVVVMMDLS